MKKKLLFVFLLLSCFGVHLFSMRSPIRACLMYYRNNEKVIEFYSKLFHFINKKYEKKCGYCKWSHFSNENIFEEINSFLNFCDKIMEYFDNDSKHKKICDICEHLKDRMIFKEENGIKYISINNCTIPKIQGVKPKGVFIIQKQLFDMVNNFLKMEKQSNEEQNFVRQKLGKTNCPMLQNSDPIDDFCFNIVFDYTSPTLN
jgi:hypothetical protein